MLWCVSSFMHRRLQFSQPNLQQLKQFRHKTYFNVFLAFWPFFLWYITAHIMFPPFSISSLQCYNWLRGNQYWMVNWWFTLRAVEWPSLLLPGQIHNNPGRVQRCRRNGKQCFHDVRGAAGTRWVLTLVGVWYGSWYPQVHTTCTSYFVIRDRARTKNYVLFCSKWMKWTA